jgi:uncharacterized RDD family membrane protein YckC
MNAQAPASGYFANDEIYTGEAVALELPSASVVTRFASALIDLLVLSAIGAVTATWFVLAGISLNEALLQVLAIAFVVLILVGWPVILETRLHGRSLGKMALGLRVVRDDAGPISAQHAFLRALVGFVEIYLFGGVPAVITMLGNNKGKRLGDFAAGTYVVRDRIALRLPPPPQIPTPLAAWAQIADIGALPPELALAGRQFVFRIGELSPATRQQMGHQLAEQFATRAAPPVPLGTPPEAFIAAVLALVRERDSRRLTQAESLRQRLRQGLSE